MTREKIEEYIEVIYELEKNNKIANTVKIASKLEIKPGSVTEFLQKLEKIGLIQYQPYYGVKLTPMGEKLAKSLEKKHKTLAKFFYEILGVNKKIAEKDACEIEHHVSRETIEKLIDFIENMKGRKK
ncbi:MAG TPA: metal-dependent transcriptional regulator [Thermoplasmatales archaeon]|nr:metal-dependent transcriptional regulator [Thermoplasmatales archaeon]